MTKFLSFCYLSAIALGYVLPGDISKQDGPAPLVFDFTVVRNTEDLSTRDLGAHQDGKNTKRDPFAESLINFQNVYYQINLYLGSNKQKNTVVVDTGSSDLWVPAAGYSPNSSTTSKDTGINFGMRYFDGSGAVGEYYQDTLGFDSGTNQLSNFQFGVSSVGNVGILGLGNRNREVANEKYDNLPWALNKAGITPKASYSLYLDADHSAGVVIFGGVDTEKFSGCLTKYPVQTPGQDLTLTLQRLKLGGKEVSINSTYDLDSGTSLGYLGDEAMHVLDALFNTTVITQGNLGYRMTSCNQPSDQFVDFDFGANTISIPYSEMIVHNDDGTCLLGFISSPGTQILGDVFLRHVYVYFDLSGQTISLAQSKPGASSNIVSV